MRDMVSSTRLFSSLSDTLATLTTKSRPRSMVVTCRFILLSELNLVPGFSCYHRYPLGTTRQDYHFIVSSNHLDYFKGGNFSDSGSAITLSSRLLDTLHLMTTNTGRDRFSPSIQVKVHHFLNVFLSRRLSLSLCSHHTTFR